VHAQCSDVYLTTVYGENIECDTFIPMPNRDIFQAVGDGKEQEVCRACCVPFVCLSCCPCMADLPSYALVIYIAYKGRRA
jgi:hypothetical protein